MCLFLLQSIEEVGGYVLIALNTVSKIRLDNLRIIRGHSLYEKKFALSVIANFNKSTGQGTSELLLNSLTGLPVHPTEQTLTDIFCRIVLFVCFLNILILAPFPEILKGGIKISSKLLCNVETIQWYDIVNVETKPVMELTVASNNPQCTYNC